MARKILVTGGTAVVVGAGAFLASRALRRRRTNGAQRLADAIPIHSKWWREQRKLSGELLYVALGDSAAQGIGASLPGRGYVGMLSKEIRRATARSVQVANLSQSGARLREALAVLLPKLEGLEPDVMTVAIGANDIADFEAERFARELDELYRALPSHAIVADIPSFYFGASERKVAVANVILRETASRYGLTVAPLHARTRRQTGAWYALNQVSVDFFHPNDRGYAVWASAFAAPLARRLVQLRQRSESEPRTATSAQPAAK